MVEVTFLPPNTSILQRVDQNVVVNFKLYYLKFISTEYLEATDGEDKLL
jgi:hypothetical protein